MAKAEDLGLDDVEGVLRDTLGLEGRVGRRRQWNMLCPVHSDTSPSCDVDLDTGYWNCFSCDAAGDIVELAHVVLGKSRAECRRMLKVKDPDLRLAGARRRAKALREAVVPPKARKEPWSPVVPPAGSYSPGPLDSLLDRGFTEETLRRWGVRFSHRVVLHKDPDSLTEDENPSFELKAVCCIPVMEKGHVYLWAYRKTSDSFDWQPKELFTPGGPKQMHWFGIQHHRNEDEVAVVEGPLDAMWLDQWGIPALALMGSQLKNEVANFRKVDQLSSYRKVTFFMDNDDGGLSGTLQLGRLLHERGVEVRVVLYPSWTPPKADPLDLAGLDCQVLYWRAVPWLKFMHRGAVSARQHR